ncbi:sugar ABC transporter permease [Roseateles aquatilis]|uniref:Sugar ABC transporter permease n=1 Tax=Roseateles aquatilis TaxID=431061 RepID=A0A2D0AMA6_9BURK|nr:carbohydrate ABC transporter permease [Roseateles aquatilis]OWQ85349.1 sugar ABC transporter permease [Roseateles aquatilis]
MARPERVRPWSVDRRRAVGGGCARPRSARGRPWLAWALVIAGAVVLVSPLYFTFVFATHGRAEIFNSPPPLGFGDAAVSNLRLLEERLPFWRNLGMSLYVASMTTALNLLLCSLAGYGFAIYEFRFKRPLFAVVLGSMMLPSFLHMIPSFMVMDALGWIDEPRALYVPAAASALGIFLMRQYIGAAIPRDLLDAARIDGCGELRIFWSIVLPLLKPALGTLGLITFIASWNNFVGPLVVMRSVEHYTLPLALRSMQAPNNTEWGALMMGSAIAMLPLLVAYCFSARRLVAGLTSGAVRG